MKSEKLFMKAILPALMLGAAFGISVLLLIALPIPISSAVQQILFVSVTCAIAIVTALEVYHKLYRSWLSTKQDEITERLRQRAKAIGGEAEENLDITLKYMEANGILADY